MKIIKFRVLNYKSIVDSGECFLEDNFTILAGKNESGKTAILEALGDVMGVYLRNKIYWMSYVDNKGIRQRESTDVTDKAQALVFYYKKKTEVAEGKHLDKKTYKKIKFEEFAYNVPGKLDH